MGKYAVIFFIALLLLNWGVYGMDPIQSALALVNLADDTLNRGKKITHQTPDQTTVRKTWCYVDQTPAELALEASEFISERSGEEVSVSVRAYTMARVIRSERSPGGPNAEAVAIGWVLRNVAEGSYGGDYLRAATANNGRYGAQGLHGSRFATSTDPYESDLTLALGILTGEIHDNTQGARNFVHPRGFKTVEKYQEVKASWMAKGLRPLAITGAPQIEVFV